MQLPALVDPLSEDFPDPLRDGKGIRRNRNDDGEGPREISISSFDRSSRDRERAL